MLHAWVTQPHDHDGQGVVTVPTTCSSGSRARSSLCVNLDATQSLGEALAGAVQRVGVRGHVQRHWQRLVPADGIDRSSSLTRHAARSALLRPPPAAGTARWHLVAAESRGNPRRRTLAASVSSEVDDRVHAHTYPRTVGRVSKIEIDDLLMRLQPGRLCEVGQPQRVRRRTFLLAPVVPKDRAHHARRRAR